jgi:hypothetical protein
MAYQNYKTSMVLWTTIFHQVVEVVVSKQYGFLQIPFISSPCLLLVISESFASSENSVEDGHSQAGC